MLKGLLLSKKQGVKMGNRCLITNKNKKIAIYQHWNGGRDTIEPLLRVAEYEFQKNPYKFGCDEFKAVLDVSKKVFDGKECDYERNQNIASDNGVYVVEEFKIIERLNNRYSEQREHNPLQMELYISLVYNLGKEEAERLMEKIEKYSKNEELFQLYEISIYELVRIFNSTKNRQEFIFYYSKDSENKLSVCVDYEDNNKEVVIFKIFIYEYSSENQDWDIAQQKNIGRYEVGQKVQKPPLIERRMMEEIFQLEENKK